MRRLLIFPLGLILLLLIILFTRFFTIHKLECTTQFGPCSDAHTEPARILLDKNILLPLPLLEVQNIYKSKLEIKSVSLLKKYPSTLFIKLEIREPIGVIDSTIAGTNSLLVDSDGIVLGSITSSPLPLLIIPDLIPEIKSITQSQVLALNSLSKMSKLTNTRIIGNLENTILTATYSKGPKIIIDIGDNVDRWYFPLQQVLERSKITSKSPSKIDLRFKDPVLTY